MKRILVIRRDNIGDLVCTTPLFTALRRLHPQAWIGALVNSYNAPVLERNPDLDEVLAYRKLKHLGPGESALGTLGERVRQLWHLRTSRLDCVVLALPMRQPRTLRLARLLAPARIVAAQVDTPAAGKHEVELVFELARELGAQGEIPPLTVVPDPAEVENVAKVLRGFSAKKSIAIHISARRPRQRWPAERFAELISRVRSEGTAVVLLWAPGSADDPQHPGDDEKAQAILRSLASDRGVLAYPTLRLQTLIGALAACDAVLCADGGAMHLAAALKKPLVALFGDSSPERWRPWGTEHRVLRPASRDVSDLTVDEVLNALRSLPAAA